MSELEEMLPKKGEEKNERPVESKPETAEKVSPLEKRNKCYAMIDDAALNAVNSAKQYRQFLDVVSRFDRYSLNNQLLILAQNPEATLLKEFESWAKEKLAIRKGSHGIMMLYPSDYTDKDGVQKRGYDVKTVFDCSCVEDYEPIEKPEHTHRELMKALIKACPVTIMVLDNYPQNIAEGAYFDASEKCVYARPGMDNAEMFTALVKAAAHAEIARRDGESYRPETAEFEARSIAYVLATKYEIPGDLVAIGSVPANLREMDGEDIKTELKKMQTSVKEMSGRMTESLAKSQEQKKAEQQKDHREAR